MRLAPLALVLELWGPPGPQTEPPGPSPEPPLLSSEEAPLQPPETMGRGSPQGHAVPSQHPVTSESHLHVAETTRA